MTMDEAFSYDGKSVDDEMVAVGSDESNDDEELSGHEIQLSPAGINQYLTDQHQLVHHEAVLYAN